MTTLSGTLGVPLSWSETPTIKVEWDYRLQEILDSIMRGIAQAARSEGRLLNDADLATDDD